MAITCEVLRDPAQLATLDSAWRELLQRSDTNEPALAPFWLRAWWRVFGEQGGRTLRVLSMFDGDRLIGLVPLLARRHWYRHGLPFRRLELLGSGEDEEDEICSEYLGVVAERGREAEVTAELANALAKLRLGEWDEVVFPSMRGESRAARMLLEALERAGLAVEASVTADCPYIALPATFDDYLARLSSSNRQFVKRSVSSFEAWAQDDVQWREARTVEELEHASSILRALHHERWSAAGQRGVFASRRFREFHDEVMRELLSAGALELSWLVVRNEPVAALYNFSWNGKVYFYQSGRKLDLPNQVRPGIVAHILAIRRAIEAGRREYDFLGGASQYKRKLATASRPLLTVRAVRSPVRELARHAIERGIGLVKTARAPSEQV